VTSTPLGETRTQIADWSMKSTGGNPQKMIENTQKNGHTLAISEVMEGTIF
jgi:hypothetical protein